MSIAAKVGCVLLVSALASCGPDVVPLPSGPTVEQACAARAQAECARRDACSHEYLVHRAYGDVASCVARLHDSCVASLAATGSGATPSVVQSCAAMYPAITCVDYLNGNLPPMCLAQVGRLGAGVACHFNAQCQSTFCAVPTGSQCGVCAPLPSVGSACNGTGAALGCGGHGLNCVGESNGAPGACASTVAANGTCDATHPCGSGLSCNGVSGSTARTCQPAGATVGAACGMANPGCDNELGLACNAMSHTCQSITLVAAGVACGVAADGSFSACASGGDCMGSTTAAPHGTCRASVADGGACDRVAGPFCKNPSSCVATATGTAGTCVPPSAASCH